MTPLTPDRQKVAAAHLPLARSMAAPFTAAYPRWGHDFESAACMGLVEAARYFDPSCNIRFATFARSRIAGSLKDALVHLRRMGLAGASRVAPGQFPGFASLKGEMRGLGPWWLSRPNRRESSSHVDAVSWSSPHEVDLDDAAEHLLRKLPGRHAQALRIVALEGKTQAEAARAMGCSSAQISRLIGQSRSLLGG